MKKILLILISILFLSNIQAQELQFSDSAIVSLITCAPGEEIYAKFGHSGIRVNDPVTKNDLIFNFGIFSFDTPNFYYKFIKGETDYSLGVHPTYYFLAQYQERNSMVWEQIINLRPAEKQKIIQALIENYLPENRIYRYNFVFDNCATRPRDKFVNSLSGHIKFQKSTEIKTYRQWVEEYVGSDTWLKFGIDLLLGRQADKVTPQYESMFLPEVLMNEFDKAEVFNQTETEKHKLVSDTQIIIRATEAKQKTDSSLTKPLFVSTILLVLLVLYSLYEYRKQKFHKIIDSILLLITGVAGVLIFYLMFVSIHPLVKVNLNILWLNPFNIIVAFLIGIKKLRPYIFVYQLINISLLVLTLIALAASVQDFNIAVFPLVVLLLIRYSLWIVRIKHRLFRKSKFMIKSKFGA